MPDFPTKYRIEMFNLKNLFSVLLLTITLSTSSNLQAAEKEHRRFTFGPVIAYRSYSEELIAPHKSDEYGPFAGFNMSFEQFKPDDLYWAVEGSYTHGWVTYDGASTNYTTNVTTPYTGDSNSDIFNFEGRVGYTLSVSPTLTYTPFIGLGYHSWYRGEIEQAVNDYSETYSWNYFALGLKAESNISDELIVGVNVKIMQMISGEMEASNIDGIFELGNRVHYELEVPVTFHLDNMPQDSVLSTIRVTPFYKNQNIGESNSVTTLFNGSFRSFYEPSSTTHVYGTKIEFVQEY